MPTTPPARPSLSSEAVAGVGDVAEPRWSPDGGRLAWVRAGFGASGLVVDGAPVPDLELGTRGSSFAWAGPDRIVVAGVGGLHSVCLEEPGGRVLLAAAAGQAAAPAIARDRVAFVDETEDACVVAVAPLDGSTPPRVVSRADFAWDPAWSPDGQLLTWHEWDDPAMPWDGSRVVVAAPDGSDRVVVAGGSDEAVGQPRFAPRGATRMAFVSDRDGWLNVAIARPDGTARHVPLFEPREHAEPAWGPGQRSFAWSPGGDALALCRNEEGFGRLVSVSVDGGPPVEWSRGWHRGLDWGRSGLAAVRSGARTAPSVVVFTEDDDQRRREVVDVAPGADALPVADHVEAHAVDWAGFDGEAVRGLLYPASSVRGNPPLLVHLHGGPTDQARVEWSPRTQFWVARGWSVFAPNPRGSTGYGRAYTRALDGEWGARDVGDVVAGIHHLVSNGRADAERVALVGGSAGAFTALLVALRAPELVRAVVASYPVTDLVALSAETHRFERHASDTLVGPVATCAARYRDRSPRTHAATLRVPVLVLQGGADPVVPATQVREFCTAVRAAGGDLELHEYPGEGHGWRRPETIADALRRSDDFLRRWVRDR